MGILVELARCQFQWCGMSIMVELARCQFQWCGMGILVEWASWWNWQDASFSGVE
ncbi:MAG: hypothetical protein F6K26_17165 [Moorea sp. SIO2I5]|nr:hypothetical protein [Moorena sp. SIO2I5]